MPRAGLRLPRLLLQLPQKPLEVIEPPLVCGIPFTVHLLYQTLSR